MTLVATSSMVHVALAAAELLEDDGISAEVVDPRTLVAARPRRRSSRQRREDGPRDRRRRGPPELRRHRRARRRDRRGRVLAPRRAGEAARRDGRARCRSRRRSRTRPCPTPELRRADRARARRKGEERRWPSAPTARWRSTGSSASTSTACARERLARAKQFLERVGARRAALLRHEQHPLHHGDPHRHVGVSTS